MSYDDLAMVAGPPVMKALAHGEPALAEDSAWIPVVKGWTSTRDFEVLSSTRFTDWFKMHKAAQHAAGSGAAKNDAQNAEGGER